MADPVNATPNTTSVPASRPQRLAADVRGEISGTRGTAGPEAVALGEATMKRGVAEYLASAQAAAEQYARQAIEFATNPSTTIKAPDQPIAGVLTGCAQTGFYAYSITITDGKVNVTTVLDGDLSYIYVGHLTLKVFRGEEEVPVGDATLVLGDKVNEVMGDVHYITIPFQADGQAEGEIHISESSESGEITIVLGSQLFYDDGSGNLTSDIPQLIEAYPEEYYDYFGFTELLPEECQEILAGGGEISALDVSRAQAAAVLADYYDAYLADHSNPENTVLLQVLRAVEKLDADFDVNALMESNQAADGEDFVVGLTDDELRLVTNFMINVGLNGAIPVADRRDLDDDGLGSFQGGKVLRIADGDSDYENDDMVVSYRVSVDFQGEFDYAPVPYSAYRIPLSELDGTYDDLASTFGGTDYVYYIEYGVADPVLYAVARNADTGLYEVVTDTDGAPIELPMETVHAYNDAYGQDFAYDYVGVEKEEITTIGGEAIYRYVYSRGEDNSIPYYGDPVNEDNLYYVYGATPAAILWSLQNAQEGDSDRIIFSGIEGNFYSDLKEGTLAELEIGTDQIGLPVGDLDARDVSSDVAVQPVKVVIPEDYYGVGGEEKK